MKKRLLIVISSVFAVLFFGAGIANASQSGVAGSLTKDQITYYTSPRTITVGGSNIYVQKTDGPEIEIMWYKCSDRNVHGPWYRLQNADPTPRTRIGSNFAVNTDFCLAALDHGSNKKDAWSGTLWWNVSS
jgi:hypothetical protein